MMYTFKGFTNIERKLDRGLKKQIMIYLICKPLTDGYVVTPWSLFTRL